MKTIIKKSILFVGLAILILACSSDTVQRNPYLISATFNVSLNTNLPLYAPLKIPGTAMYIGQNTGAGIRGVFAYNTGSDIRAWEASCPNHEPNSCSTMKLTQGGFAICDCDDFKYSLANGVLLEGGKEDVQYHNMLNYKTKVTENIIRIFN
jgi:nitrite reductase/ring-hydroxylating ferredoxin subunit